MSANPLQDNGIPKWGWFERIVTEILQIYSNGGIEYDAKQHRLGAYPTWLKKSIRRCIVRVARDAVGKMKWHSQGDSRIEAEYWKQKAIYYRRKYDEVTGCEMIDRHMGTNE